MVRDALRSSLRAKIGGLLVRPALRSIADKLDPGTYGAQPLLGVDGYAFIGHGSADARAVRNALATARKMVDAGVSDRIAEGLEGVGGCASVGVAARRRQAPVTCHGWTGRLTSRVAPGDSRTASSLVSKRATLAHRECPHGRDASAIAAVGGGDGETPVCPSPIGSCHARHLAQSSRGRRRPRLQARGSADGVSVSERLVSARRRPRSEPRGSPQECPPPVGMA